MCIFVAINYNKNTFLINMVHQEFVWNIQESARVRTASYPGEQHLVPAN